MDEETLNILAWTVLGEAAGEGRDGMAAVAHVIRNRANSGRYPDNPRDVALQTKQFSTWNTGAGGNDPVTAYPVDSKAFLNARSIVEQVFSGQIPDPTRGATHYWAKRVADPDWADEEESYGRLPIGNHIFLPRNPLYPTPLSRPDPWPSSPAPQAPPAPTGAPRSPITVTTANPLGAPLSRPDPWPSRPAAAPAMPLTRPQAARSDDAALGNALAARQAEIEAVIETDFDRYRHEGLDKEYQAILEQQIRLPKRSA